MNAQDVRFGPSDERIAAVGERFGRGLARWGPAVADAGDPLFAAVTTPNWALEWSLADWLADAYGLEREAADDLLLANVTLLAFARLMDDVADGESSLSARESTPLATGLLHSCIGTYARLFTAAPERVRFEQCFDAFLGEWMQATLGAAPLPGPDFTRYTATDFVCVAQRAAFLKIAAAAGCLAAGRGDALDALSTAMSELSVGIVMLDDLFDWPADLAAGRFNVFVAYGARGRQTADRIDANRRAMVVDLYIGGGGRPYFDSLHDHLDVARRAAGTASCEGLRHFIEWYEDEVRRCAEWLAQRTSDPRAALGRRESVGAGRRDREERS
jgi:hypothetical protein